MNSPYLLEIHNIPQSTFKTLYGFVRLVNEVHCLGVASYNTLYEVCPKFNSDLPSIDSPIVGLPIRLVMFRLLTIQNSIPIRLVWIHL